MRHNRLLSTINEIESQYSSYKQTQNKISINKQTYTQIKQLQDMIKQGLSDINNIAPGLQPYLRKLSGQLNVLIIGDIVLENIEINREQRQPIQDKIIGILNAIDKLYALIQGITPAHRNVRHNIMKFKKNVQSLSQIIF